MNKRRHFLSQSGNVFFTLFGAVGLVGVIGASTMTIMKGPVRSMHNVTQRTIAENNMIAAGKLALIAATNQPGHGDCDSDGSVEPVPFSLTGDGLFPAGGGYLPIEIGAARQDPWGNTYGYCAWDHGGVIKNGTCADDAGRLRGDAGGNGAVLAVISSGPDRVFQTSCGDAPDFVVQPSGSDDIAQVYTYGEAVASSGGLWNIKSGDPDTAEIAKNLEVKNDGGDVVFGVDAASDPARPAIKVDYIQQLSAGAVNFLSNIALGDRWISGDGDNEGIYVDANGNVGIGTSAPGEGFSDGANPKYLHVDNSGGQSVVALSNDATTDGASLGSLTFGTIGGGGNDKRGAVIYSQLVGDASTAVSGDLNFYTSNEGIIGAPKMVILPNGNVGVGTDEPLYQISVQDNADEPTTIAIENTNDSAPNARSVFFLKGDGGGRASGGLMYANSGFTLGPSYTAMRQNGLTLYTNPEAVGGMSFISAAPNSVITFNVGGYNAATEQMRIASNGNVGIGVSSPTQKLHVDGNGLFSGSVTANAYYGSSDRNLKTDIETIADPFALLNGIEGKHFLWKKSGRASYGVIAQDVESVMPEAVGENAEGFKTVEYNQLIAPLIEAVKQLDARVKALEAANDNLRAEIHSLKSEAQ